MRAGTPQLPLQPHGIPDYSLIHGRIDASLDEYSLTHLNENGRIVEAGEQSRPPSSQPPLPESDLNAGLVTNEAGWDELAQLAALLQSGMPTTIVALGTSITLGPYHADSYASFLPALLRDAIPHANPTARIFGVAGGSTSYIDACLDTLLPPTVHADAYILESPDNMMPLTAAAFADAVAPIRDTVAALRRRHARPVPILLLAPLGQSCTRSFANTPSWPAFVQAARSIAHMMQLTHPSRCCAVRMA